MKPIFNQESTACCGPTTSCCSGTDSSCGCSSAPQAGDSTKKELNIDFLFLDLNTCERCIATGDTLDEALAALSPALETLNYAVKVNKVNITTRELAEQYRFVSSPTIRVNGVDVSTELKESSCGDCSDISGCSTDCRVFVYNGKDYEQPPAAMIIEGILHILYGNVRQTEQKPYELPDNLERFFAGKSTCCGSDSECSCDDKPANSNSRSDSTMKTMYIYEPAMCCETGLCGVGVDPELLRITTVANNLKTNGVTLRRYNLNSYPQEFVTNAEINKLLNDAGVDALPATVVDGKIVKTKAYPTNGEIVMWLNIPADYLVEKAEISGGCGCKSGGCC